MGNEEWMMANEEWEKEIEYQKIIFKNRLIKNNKHISKWARRNGIFACRLYDKDIPEVPLVLDIYHAIDGVSYLHLSLYKRPYYLFQEMQELWLSNMVKVSIDVLSILPSNVFVKVRERKKGFLQYEKMNDAFCECFVVQEENARFYINLSQYIDSGLFLDHRPLRLEIARQAKFKKVLNLFCYTASFSVHAMLGGAKSVCSVDASNTAIEWAKKNLKLNGIALDENCWFEKMDVFAFLKEARAKGTKWDIIISDVPTFSNSKNRSTVFDVNKDYLSLCILCVDLLKEDGVLYFSSNSRTLKFDSSLLLSNVQEKLFIQDISLRTIPEDFRNKKIHKAWKIKREG